ncbi:kinase-like domain-containing protein, partial [Hyaloraphidium curvatum]
SPPPPNCSSSGKPRDPPWALPAFRARYLIGRKLGEGSHAAVFALTDRRTGAQVAGKMWDLRTLGTGVEFARAELAALAGWEASGNAHLAGMLGCYEGDGKVWMVTEAADGDLLDLLVRRGGYVGEGEAAWVLRAVLRGLEGMHGRGWAHRDVKPDNGLLLTMGAGSRVWLADFGFAARAGDAQALQTVCGTPAYMAPEMVDRTGHGVEVDVWACGVMLYGMLCGYLPFCSPRGSSLETMLLVKRGELKFDARDWAGVSDDAKDFISSLLERDPKVRPTAEEALRHPWL